jgi:hypothetical protein
VSRPVSTGEAESGRTLEVVSPGMVVINEIQYDPASCPDDDGEWIELRNLTPHTLDIGQLMLVDGDFNRGYLTPYELGPYEVALIGRGNPDWFCDPGAKPVAFWDWEVSLNNTGEALTLFNGKTGEVVDAAPKFPEEMVVPGVSLALDPNIREAHETDVVSAWSLSSQCGLEATPGQPNPDCEGIDLNWFDAVCTEEEGCQVGASFDPVAWVEHAQMHAGIASHNVDPELSADRLRLMSVTVSVPQLRPSEYTAEYVEHFYTFAGESASIDLAANEQTFVEVGVFDRVVTPYTMSPETQRVPMRGAEAADHLLMTFEQAAADLALEESEARIYGGGMSWSVGDDDPRLRFYAHVDGFDTEIVWNARTGERELF